MNKTKKCNCGTYEMVTFTGKLSFKMRGFEIAKGWEDKIDESFIPQRSTEGSAGYDIKAAEDIEIPPGHVANRINNKQRYDALDLQPTLVPTGIKSYMLPDEVLNLYDRSSGPIKKKLMISNAPGTVDQDYYNNPDNDGHIMVQFINISPAPVFIKKGDRIAQAKFSKFLITDNDTATQKRTGGHGSTGS